MKPTQLSRALAICMLANVPVMVRGRSGGGKTQIGHGVAKAMGRTLYHKCIPQMDELESRGLPEIMEGRTHQALPSWLPTTPGNIIFFDEFTKGRPSVANTWAEPICEGTIGGADLYTVPPETGFILTGNMKGERAGDYELHTHMKNRMAHLHYEVDVDDWARGAFNNFSTPVDISSISYIPSTSTSTSMDETLIAFFRHRPTLLHQAPSLSTGEDAFCTPRSISYLNRLLPYITEQAPDLEIDLISGMIGSGTALEYIGFRRLIDTMFDPNLCFTYPDSAPIPTNPSIMYALLVALAARVTKATASPFFRYLARLSQDMASMCVVDALARNPLLMTQCPEGVAWASKNARLLIQLS